MRLNPDYPALGGADQLDMSDLAQARARMEALLAALAPKHDDGSTILVEDARAPGPAGPLGLRLYRPAQASAPRPVLLWLHGGGFMMGGLATDDFYCRHFVRTVGCAVAALDYRLIPEHPYPAAVEDVAATVDWLADGGLGEAIDGTRLAVGGASAGANLAVVAGLVARDRAAPALRLVLANSPLLDDRCETASMAESEQWPTTNRRALRRVWDLYLGAGPASAYQAPARADRLEGYPSLLMSIGTAEPMLDEAWAFVRRLVDADVLAELHVLPGAPHGWERFGASAVTRRGLAAQADALAAAFGEGPVHAPARAEITGA